MRQLQPSLPTLPSLPGTTGQGGTKQAPESRDGGWRPPTCSQGLWGDRAEPVTHFYLECWAGLGRRVRGGPQCVGLGPRALSQPESPWQLGDRFQGNAGSGVHGGLVQQRLMGNRCKGTLCWSGPGGTGVGTSLPAPVALPPCPPGAIAGPCAGWGKEAARRQPLTCLPSLGEPFAPQEQPRNCTGVY